MPAGRPSSRRATGPLPGVRGARAVARRSDGACLARRSPPDALGRPNRRSDRDLTPGLARALRRIAPESTNAPGLVPGPHPAGNRRCRPASRPRNGPGTCASWRMNASVRGLNASVHPALRHVPGAVSQVSQVSQVSNHARAARPPPGVVSCVGPAQARCVGPAEGSTSVAWTPLEQCTAMLYTLVRGGTCNGHEAREEEG